MANPEKRIAILIDAENTQMSSLEEPYRNIKKWSRNSKESLWRLEFTRTEKLEANHE